MNHPELEVIASGKTMRLSGYLGPSQLHQDRPARWTEHVPRTVPIVSPEQWERALSAIQRGVRVCEAAARYGVPRWRLYEWVAQRKQARNDR